MSDNKFNFFVIGAGSGGVRAARLAANYGAKTGIAEMSALGGTCVNIGCIPKKLFATASHFAEDFDNAQAFGWDNIASPQFDMARFIANKDKEIHRLNDIYQSLLKEAGVQIFNGTASFISPHEIIIGDTKITADKILIATGGKPFVPDVEGQQYASISDDLFTLKQTPQRVIVVGGGYIAVEFASILNGLGSQVTQIHRGSRLLREFDEDLALCLGEEMQKKGMQFIFNDTPSRLNKNNDGSITLELSNNESITADKVFYATGRKPNTASLNLNKAGVQYQSNGTIEVNDDFQTSTPHIYAVGDVIGKIALTPVALRQATILADKLFAKPKLTIDYDLIATAVFSNPPIGSIGLTPAIADKYGIAYQCYQAKFIPLQNRLTNNNSQAFVKILVEKSSDKVLGLYMLGDNAPEIVQGFAVAIMAGATKRDFDLTIGIHPTAAEEFVTLRTPNK